MCVPSATQNVLINLRCTNIVSLKYILCGCRQLPGGVLQRWCAGLHHGAAPLLLFLLLPDLGPPDEAQLRLPPGAGILRRGLATPRDTVQVGHNTIHRTMILCVFMLCALLIEIKLRNQFALCRASPLIPDNISLNVNIIAFVILFIFCLILLHGSPSCCLLINIVTVSFNFIIFPITTL